jgi:hypothetical protein
VFTFLTCFVCCTRWHEIFPVFNLKNCKNMYLTNSQSTSRICKKKIQKIKFYPWASLVTSILINCRDLINVLSSSTYSAKIMKFFSRNRTWNSCDIILNIFGNNCYIERFKNSQLTKIELLLLFCPKFVQLLTILDTSGAKNSKFFVAGKLNQNSRLD